MIANRTVGRKQLVVTGVSVLLAVGSCFIPLRDPPPPAASQAVNPPLPTQQPASEPAAPNDATIKILLAAQRADELNRAARPSGGDDDLTASAPAAVSGPPQTGQSGVLQPLSPPDFHSGAPDLKLMQILPVNQSGQF